MKVLEKMSQIKIFGTDIKLSKIFLKNNEYNFVKNCENKNKDWSKKLWEARLQKL